MGQTQTSSRGAGQTQRAFQSVRTQNFFNKRIEHEGILTLRSVPFKNCIEIQTQTTSLFLQNVQITLRDLLDSRIYTNKLFPKQDIERLIQNVLYTLAFLAQNKISYKDVSSQNIFYDDGSFKLLPNQLIHESRYLRFINSRLQKNHVESSKQQQTQFVTISPQMIIAYRCKQSFISELDILNKSNVFCFGLLLLQTATLLPSHECYDNETCDILDEVITGRIQLLKEYYSQEIASIVANMLDYDYQQRMSLKEISIFVNRELNRDLIANSKISKQLSNKKLQKPQVNEGIICQEPFIEDAYSAVNHSQAKNIQICKSRLQSHEDNESRISKPSQIGSTSQKKKIKTNKVYMNGGAQLQIEEQSTFNREDRNKVYMKSSQLQQEPKKLYQNDQYLNQCPKTVLRQISHTNNVSLYSDSQIHYQPGKLLNFNARQKHAPPIPTFTQKTNCYKLNNKAQQQNRYPLTNQEYPQQKNLKRKNSTDYLGYRANNQNHIIKTPKHQKKSYNQNHAQFQSRDQYDEKQVFFNNNNYNYQNNSRQDSDFGLYQKKDNGFGQKFIAKQSPLNEDSGSRGYFQANKMINSRSNNQTEFKNHDHSLSRIKSEIQRSRKLIEQFKRGQNVQY